MHTISSAFYHLRDTLLPLYDEREAASIAHEVMNHITRWSKTERLIQKETLLNDEQLTTFQQVVALLSTGVPLQYVTGIAWFMGLSFKVDKSVLIPRPETEELVQWILDDHKTTTTPQTILDVGTGSGCIPISLKKKLPTTTIASCDISPEALAVAQENAATLNAEITFLQLDFLNLAAHNSLDKYNIIVSNPPYIPRSEKETLHINVRDNEPALALFVPDDDALIFYRALAIFGQEHLEQGGFIYCELDAAHALATKTLFEKEGYKNVVLRQDMQGNNRMLRAALH